MTDYYQYYLQLKEKIRRRNPNKMSEFPEFDEWLDDERLTYQNERENKEIT